MNRWPEYAYCAFSTDFDRTNFGCGPVCTIIIFRLMSMTERNQMVVRSVIVLGIHCGCLSDRSQYNISIDSDCVIYFQALSTFEQGTKDARQKDTHRQSDRRFCFIARFRLMRKQICNELDEKTVKIQLYDSLNFDSVRHTCSELLWDVRKKFKQTEKERTWNTGTIVVMAKEKKNNNKIYIKKTAESRRSNSYCGFSIRYMNTMHVMEADDSQRTLYDALNVYRIHFDLSNFEHQI